MDGLVYDLAIGSSQDGRQDRPKRAPGGILGRLGGILDRSWGLLSPLGTVLEGFWAVLRGSWAALRGFWALYGFDQLIQFMDSILLLDSLIRFIDSKQ